MAKETPRQVDLKIVAPYLNISAAREAGVAAWFREQANNFSGTGRDRYLTLAAEHENLAADAQRAVQVGVVAIGSAFAQIKIEVTRQGPTTVVEPSARAASLPGDPRRALGMTRAGPQVDSQLISRVAIEAAKDRVGELPAGAGEYFSKYNGPTLVDVVRRAAYALIHLGQTPEEAIAQHDRKIQQAAADLGGQLAERTQQIRLRSIQNAAPISLDNYEQFSAAPHNSLAAAQEAADYAAIITSMNTSSWSEGWTQHTQTSYADNTPSLDQMLSRD